jgi:hypothetical protein
VTTNNNTTHKHLCGDCGKTFDCAGEDCADFEFGTCAECQSQEATSSKSSRKKKKGGKQS